MFTLTHHDRVVDGRRSKAALNRLLNAFRDRGVRCVWWMEFQARGAIHYHLLAEGEQALSWVREAWLSASGQAGDRAARYWSVSRTVRRASRTMAVAYACKYGAKRDQKIAPEDAQGIGRFWGSSRGLDLVEDVCELAPEAAVMLRAATRSMVEGRSGRRWSSRADGFMLPGEVWEYKGERRSGGGLTPGQLGALLWWFARKGWVRWWDDRPVVGRSVDYWQERVRRLGRAGEAAMVPVG